MYSLRNFILLMNCILLTKLVSRYTIYTKMRGMSTIKFVIFTKTGSIHCILFIYIYMYVYMCVCVNSLVDKFSIRK
jgi:hypothetical protein